MEKTTIYLIRHGEINNPKGIIYGRSVDVPLNQAGAMQIEALARKLQKQGVKPDVIYTSPLSRAVKSALKLNEVYGGDIPIIKEDNLQDVDHSGLETKTIKWLRSIGEDVYNYHGPEVAGANIELPEHQAERITGILGKIQKEHRGETIFVVSHGHPTVFAMWRLLYPDSPVIPSIREINRDFSLEKGEAWRIVFDEKGKVLEHERVRRSRLEEIEGEIKGERKY